MARIIDTSTILTEADIQRLDHNAREAVYNGLDTTVTFEIAHELEQLLDSVTRPTYNFSAALQAPILEMTMRGVLVDQGKKQEVLMLLQRNIMQLEAQLTEIVRGGIGFTDTENKGKSRWWRSNDKIKNLLYGVMGLKPVSKRNSSGVWAPTVNRDALEHLRDAYFTAEPIVIHLLALRDIDKKRGFLETGIDPDGRMRSNFNIAGTDTGRLSSSFSDFGTGTNLQNVDRELRSIFVADRGYKFANLDLEQGDARNVGAVCWNLFVEEHGDSFAGSYLDACESGDLHTYNSRLIWPEKAWTGNLAADKKIAEVIFYRQDSFRQMSKKGGHATNYYGTPRTVAKHLKVPTTLIEEFQRRYFQAYPVIGSYDPKHNDREGSLPNWHNWVRKRLEETHSITTLMGRRRQFFGRSFDDTTLRQAISYEPQSLTADFIDTGILNLWRANRVQLLIQVHDSILLQYPENEEETILPWALETLKTHIRLKKDRDFVVPTEAKVGWNWGEQADDNADGLIKWKGSDSRKRERLPWLKPQSLFGL